MLQIRKILLRGTNLVDAEISFEAGANILSGESDTGKSLLVHCLDYVLGAKTFKKAELDILKGYSALFVEFVNDKKEKLTLERQLAGRNLIAYYSSIKEISGPGKKVLSKRAAKGNADDVTSILFPFGGIPDAQLRKNVRGDLIRLSIRMLIPIFLIDENSVISDDSPIVGKKSFDATARKRMLAFVLSGIDDNGIVASENNQIAIARLSAELGLMDKLIAPLELRLATLDLSDTTKSVAKIEGALSDLTLAIESTSAESEALQTHQRTEIKALQYAESQLLAINELQARYDLLDDRYRSDLKRLDFVVEGSHYLDALQLVNCPCCNQPFSMSHANDRSSQIDNATLQAAAAAESQKILVLIKDLAATKQSLGERKLIHEKNLNISKLNLIVSETRLAEVLAPAAKVSAAEIDILLNRRLELESLTQDWTRLNNLKSMKAVLEKTSESDESEKIEWESLPSKALAGLCREVEKVLIAWTWASTCRVDFDETEFDIIVDGQARQSHGKGVRGILYSALVLALLQFCKKNGRPHPGVVVIDSPLTSYKKSPKRTNSDVPVSAGIEAAFWQSLLSLDSAIQVIVIENKEPPDDVASKVHYERFVGDEAAVGERAGFIPTSSYLERMKIKAAKD